MAATIHHSTIKSAEKQGIMLEVEGAVIRALIPAIGVRVFGVSGQDAIKQANAARILYSEHNMKFVHGDDPKTIGKVTWAGTEADLQTTPVEYQRLVEEGEVGTLQTHSPSQGEPGFEPDAEKPEVDPTPLVKRAENGIALDGAIAYKEGIMAADNPFEEGTDEADAWDAQWDQAADDSPEAQEKEHTGSVVSSRYRTKYKEAGHPTHSGDWLALLLNNYCVGKKETDLAMFERICAMNNVDLSKYNRTTPGWQGRLRMTGRNLLARRVFEAKHIVVPVIDSGDTQQIAAPSDWLSAQRFNKPSKEG